MRVSPAVQSPLRWLGLGAGAAAGAYAAYVALTWRTYGKAMRPRPEEADALLDRFMPDYEIVERHHVRVGAPPEATLAAAGALNLFEAPLVRAIFKGRELVLGARPDDKPRPHGLLDEVRSLGWVVLAELPGREIVLGAVTKPWHADVTFRSVPPDEFAAFAEPDYVKIAWTLRADPAGDGRSIFRTETRAIATDAAARRKFRRYWSLLSPGIILIRTMMTAQLKCAVERQAGSGESASIAAAH